MIESFNELTLAHRDAFGRRPTQHHSRTVSWQTSIPRSNNRSSTFRNDSGNRTYIITTSRITSGEEWK